MGLRTDEELMAAYVDGEQAAFRELFGRLAPALMRTLRRRVGNESDARDLVQQTFLNVHRSRRDFRPGSRVRPWLYTIAFNLARDRARRARRRPQAEFADGAGARVPASVGDPERQALGGDVRDALAALPDAQREVIVLHWYEGLAFSEIATVVGASVGAVKVRAHRGYERLRARLRVTDGGGAT